MKIVIVGGGFSGLMSAFLLETTLGSDVEIVILESTGRLGGRIQTDRLRSSNGYYDCGAAELYEIRGGYSLKALAHNLGLKTRTMFATPFFSFDGRLLKDADDFRSALGTVGIDALESFWKRVTANRSTDEYASAGHPSDNHHPWFHQNFSETLSTIDSERARLFTQTQVHSDVAAEPDHTSGLFGVDNLLIDHPDYVEMFSIVGGNERLIDGIAERVNAEVLLEAAVRAIAVQADGRYCVTYALPEISGPQQLTADFLLITPPPAALRNIVFSPGSLHRAIAAHIEHHDHSAPYLRATIVSREQSWTRVFPEDYFVADAFSGVTAYDKTVQENGSSVPILSILVAGNDAGALASLPDGDVLLSLLAALPKSAGVKVGSIEEFRVDRWLGEWGVSRLPGGRPLLSLEHRHNPAPAFPRLLMLGDYLYDATINGALDACLFVARKINETLTGRRVESVEELPHVTTFLKPTTPRHNGPIIKDARLPFLKIVGDAVNET